MYQWYREAQICLVYLHDVHKANGPPDPGRFRILVETAKWWTRGWTLQELLAPSKLWFFDASWAFLASKEGQSPVIAAITAIPEFILLGADPGGRFNSSKNVLGVQKANHEARGHGVLPDGDFQCPYATPVRRGHASLRQTARGDHQNF